MAVDLENLRLDIPEEDFSKPDGVSAFWRVSTLALLLTVGGLAYFHFFYSPPGDTGDAIAVRTHTVAFATPEAETEFTAGGWVDPQWPYPVKASALVPGRLELLLVTEGQNVRRGEVVAFINSDVLEQELITAEARILKAEEEITRAEARVDLLEAGARDEEIEVAAAARDRAEARLNRMLAGFRDEEIARAEANLREAQALAMQRRNRAVRMKKLADEETIPDSKAEEYKAEAVAAEERVESLSQELRRLRAGYRDVEVEEARAELAEAKRKLELVQAGTRAEEIAEAEAALAVAEAELEAAEAELELIELRIERCRVEAPGDGRVLEILAPQGSTLAEKEMAIFTIYDPARMQCRVDVRQEQAASLFVGQRCTVKLAARKGQPYSGTVIRVNPLANLARDTVRAIVTIDDADENLRKDMTATVDFHPRSDLAPGDDLPLALPEGAVHSRDGKTYVFLIRGGAAQLREVELGEEADFGFPVISGVQQGDMVATTNLAVLKDGASVRLELEAQE